MAARSNETNDYRDHGRRLTPDAVALYRHAIAHPGWTPKDAFSHLGLYGDRLDAALDALKGSRLLQPSPDPCRAWDAVSPHGAVADLLTDEEMRVRRAEARLATAREELLGLLPTYFEARRTRAVDEGIDVLRGDVTVSRLLAQHTEQAVAEVCACGRGVDLVDAGWLADRSDTGRSASARLVLATGEGESVPAPDLLTVDVRTAPHVPIQLVVFDREIAFLPMSGPHGRTGQADGMDERVAVVRHPAVVESLAAAFDLVWASARPVFDGGAGDAGEAHACLRREILCHLADGDKDEVIARRLGLSVRTCRRHIAAIMGGLGASSRFQAGVLAERSLLAVSD